MELNRRLMLMLLLAGTVAVPVVSVCPGQALAKDGGGGKDGGDDGGDDGGKDDGGNDDGGNDDGGNDDGGNDDGGNDDGGNDDGGDDSGDDGGNDDGGNDDGGTDDGGNDDGGDDDGGNDNSTSNSRSEQDKVLDAVRSGEIISLEKALAVVQQKYKGQVIDVRLSKHLGKSVYGVKVRLAETSKIRLIRVDAKTGKLVNFLGF